ncbi:MAG: GNAT family N-acetyltransferase [Chloroflexota bacterium]|nr:GNAT family N-acetyltransferase [Chloroflexota bacterium]
MAQSRDTGGEARNVIKDLGDGLILRRSTSEDAERLARFNAAIHANTTTKVSNEPVAAWTRDLLSGRHPTFGVGDFTLVEDLHTGEIVSALCLIPQRWSYEDIEFGVGRPEIVATHPDYRRRGLVRAQFDLIHAWSAERGDLMQAITGIPWYYRQFGYEMGLELGGGRAGFTSQIPALKPGQVEPYLIQAATGGDIPFVTEMYAQMARRGIVSCVRAGALWRHELSGHSPDSAGRNEIRVIENAAGDHCGMLVHGYELQSAAIPLYSYELKPGLSFLDATPSVLRYLARMGQEYVVRDKVAEWSSYYFSLGSDHPVYHVTPDFLPQIHRPYAWYVRVTNLPGFLRLVSPVLERRLAASAVAGHSGELKINLYTSGLRITLEGGKVASVEGWQPESVHDGAAGFPDLSFLQLLLGYRSLDEIKYAYADCGTRGSDTPALLDALFPTRVSHVWGML